MKNVIQTVERVRFAECDGMGVMHHSRYIIWLEGARLALASESSIDFNALTKEKIYFPLMEVHCKYHKFAFCGDVVQITCELERPTKFAKMIFNYKIHRKKGMELLLTAKTVHSILTTGKGMLINMPADFRARLEKLFDDNEMEGIRDAIY